MIIEELLNLYTRIIKQTFAVRITYDPHHNNIFLQTIYRRNYITIVHSITEGTW